MVLETLISTMNQKNDSFLNKMNTQGKTLVINQSIENFKISNYSSRRFILMNTFGLSKSRNFAIENSIGNLCLIADDDINYVNGYDKKIQEFHLMYKKYDIICFKLNSNSQVRKKKYFKKIKKLGFISSMKVSSVEISFKKNSIISTNIKFDENFGSGSNFFSNGEENIFLFDCLKKGLKILYIPYVIGQIDFTSSSWFKGFNYKFFFDKGAMFYRMSKFFYIPLILQFSLRKFHLSEERFSFFKVLTIMFKGARFYMNNCLL